MVAFILKHELKRISLVAFILKHDVYV